MFKKIMKVITLSLLAISSVYATDSGRSGADLARLSRQYANSWVKVEYYLRYDKGETPQISGMVEYCSNCGSYHSIGSADNYLKEERPMELGGLVISDSQILTPDALVNARFIERIAVTFGEDRVDAEISGYNVNNGTVILKVKKLPDGAKPVIFSQKSSDELYIIEYKEFNAQWHIAVDPFSLSSQLNSDGTITRNSIKTGLVVDANGNAICSYHGQLLPESDDWMVSPLDEVVISANRYNDLTSKIEELCKNTVLRCQLNFRSPAKKVSILSRYIREEQQETEQYTYAIVVAPDRIIIPTTLQPEKTARLEKITVYNAAGEKIEAKFESSIKDFGMLTATLARPLPEAAAISNEMINKYLGQTLPLVEIKILGDDLIFNYNRSKILSLDSGWKKMIYPELPNVNLWSSDDANVSYLLFNELAEIISIPLSKRPKVQQQTDSWSRYSDYENINMTPMNYISNIIARPQDFADANNTPLNEAEANKTAWMGVVLQGMNDELARLNKVSEVTHNGEIGAIVSYVYPGSPAEKAGIEPGMILTRIHSTDNPVPIDVSINDELSTYMSSFPWERLDEVPAQYFSELPAPWPAAENEVGLQLKAIGFGEKYTAEFYRNGQRTDIEMVVEECPTHYDSAKKFKSDDIELTVRDLTFEVRRYMQISEDEPGVIVSGAEQGGKADIAKIKIFEVITHINDTPIMNVDQFEKTIAQGGNLQIAIKRMNKSRVVNISM